MKLMQLIAAASTAAVLGTAGVSVAGAVSGGSSTPPAPATTTAATPGAASYPKVARKVGRGALVIAAKTIGITPADLAKELKAGKTVAQVATEHNVTPQAVINALVTAATEKINAAHTAHKITDAQATKLEQNLTARATLLVNAQHPYAKAKAKLGGKARALVRGVAKIAAKTIGVTPADLAKELKAGKTVAQVATEHNVTPQAVINALVTAATEKINAAHTAHKITDAQATKLEQRATARATTFVNTWHPKHT